MAGGGTGQPNFFACAKCRLKWGMMWPNTSRRTGYVRDVKLTGRVRGQKNRIGGPRVAATRYQYTCKVCDHTGWSRHYEIADLALREKVRPHKTDTYGLRDFEAKWAKRKHQ